MGVMRRLSCEGDSETTWTPGDPGSTAAAEAVFKRALKRGGSAFATEGSESVHMLRFDPNVGEIIIFQRIAGGA
jgi:hypothetical protein